MISNIIKNIALFIMILFQAYPLNAQHNMQSKRFTLTGTMTAKQTTFLRLSYRDQYGKYIEDTCYLKNGNFTFTGYINGPTAANLLGYSKSSSIEDLNSTMIFLEPVYMKCILIENNFKNAKVTGSVTQDEFETLKMRKQSNNRQEDKLTIKLRSIDKIIQHGDTLHAIKSKRKKIWNEYLKFRELDKQIDYVFISTHPGSYLSPYLMDYYFRGRKLSLDSAELFYGNFKEKIQKSLYGQLIHNQIVARKLSQTGKAAPMFSKIDIRGNEVNLSSFKYKYYVLLDFWASWCEPCREITPILKELYNKFHSKGLVIISISWDFNKESWKNAINKDSINDWYNIFGNISHDKGNSIRKKYAIVSIPTLILIDKNGIIIGRYRERGEDGDEMDLYNKLNKVFVNK